MIVWAGTSSKDVGMVIEHYPSVIMPQKNVDVQQVPGRNDDIVIPTGSFQNYAQNYAAFLDSKFMGGLESAMPKIVDWLLGHDGYQRLEDSYFPDVYRMAYYTGGSEFVSFFNEYGEGTLQFNCAPEKYYKSGEHSIDIPSSGKVLINPSSFAACPIIEADFPLTGTSAVIDINGRRVTIRPDPDIIVAQDLGIPEVMIIDVKNHRYRAKVNTTQYGEGFTGKFEDLKLGKTSTISWSGDLMALRIIPNWWTI